MVATEGKKKEGEERKKKMVFDSNKRKREEEWGSSQEAGEKFVFGSCVRVKNEFFFFIFYFLN